MDLNSVHKPEPTLISAIFRRFVIEKLTRMGLCYDEVVWQRQAIRHGRVFLQHVVPAIVKPARALWNEVIGFFFLCFAGLFGFKAVGYARDYFRAGTGGGNGELVRLLMAGFCTLLMAWYGISSFRRARKISRS